MAGPSLEGTSLDAGSVHGEHVSATTASGEARDDAGDDLELALGDEVARLEGLLVERARALQVANAELARAHMLLRDAAASFELALTRTPDPARFGQLERQRDAAAARALEAEAARAELCFRLDEVLGHIAEAGTTAIVPAPATDIAPALRGGASTMTDIAPALRGGASTMTDIAPALRGGASTMTDIAPALRGGASSMTDIAPALRGGASSTTESGEPLDLAYARLSGTVRGLTSVLAETQEARDLAGARLVLHEQDLAVAKQRARGLERDLAEARERVEFEALRAHGLARQLEIAAESRKDAAASDASQADELRGELAGARARRDEGERVAETLVAAIEALSSRSASEISVLKQAVAQEAETSHEAASALARAQAEAMVLREQLTRVQEDMAALRASFRERQGEQGRDDQQLEAERAAVQRSVIEQRSRAERLRDALREARHLLGELAGALDRTSRSVHPVTRAADDETPVDEQTQPGMPTYIEAMEGLEELVALRDDHIRELTTKLQLERDRVRAVERVVRALEPSAGSLPSAEWAELMALVQRK